MKIRSRRLVATLSVVAAVTVFASVAIAGTDAMNLISNNNTTTLPAKNPSNLKATGSKAYAWGIPATAITNQESTQQLAWGDPETTGGGSVNISKYTSKDDNGYTTVTVKSLDSGLIIANAMATISGGQHGAVQIKSTSISNDGTTYTVKLKFPGEEGTVGTLNLKWYTLQLAL